MQTPLASVQKPRRQHSHPSTCILCSPKPRSTTGVSPLMPPELHWFVSHKGSNSRFCWLYHKAVTCPEVQQCAKQLSSTFKLFVLWLFFFFFLCTLGQVQFLSLQILCSNSIGNCSRSFICLSYSGSTLNISPRNAEVLFSQSRTPSHFEKTCWKVIKSLTSCRSKSL